MDMCCRFVLVVSFLLYSIVRLSSAHPLVSTSLSSGWSVTPIELQFSEWIAVSLSLAVLGI